MVKKAREIKKRVGGRSARVHDAVLKSVFELLREKGPSELSIAEVAERAGVHETSIYRRWPSRHELILDAARHFVGDALPIPDTGALRSDLVAFQRSAKAMLASRQGQVIIMLSSMQDAGARTRRHAYWKKRLEGLRVTPSLFSTLGVGASMGRVFGADDAVVGRDRVVVLSDALWRNRFDADPKITERSLRLDGESYRVIGVLPTDFMFPRVEVGLFVPYAFKPEQLADDQRGVNDSQIVARLAQGATIAQVDAQIAAMVQRNVERTAAGKDGDSYKHWVTEIGLSFGARPPCGGTNFFASWRAARCTTWRAASTPRKLSRNISCVRCRTGSVCTSRPSLTAN